ncbi:hypothetical protein D770_09135 [Flammeovirgaceae bacterium 311]|nr:hypothetical protein D770_09135 [Flammeovirgaceae bacterium 311]
MLQETIQGLGPAAGAAQPKAAAAAVDIRTAAVAAEARVPGLKIARTTMPDLRLDYNQTFQHIRTELDGYYKERNPIFSNTIARNRKQY